MVSKGEKGEKWVYHKDVTYIIMLLAGFEINARPLARGDWKPRGMSRIFAQVVRRASGYFNLFCQLYVTMNETNY